MKLIIYWLILMVIAPLFYLWWCKKRWRTILGIIIFAILVTGYLLPGKIAFSILKRELKKEEDKRERENWIDKRNKKRGLPWQKLEEALKTTLQQEITPKNQEKIQLEKEILKLKEERKEIDQEKKQIEEKEREYYRNQYLPEWQGKGEGIRKNYLKILDKSIKNGYLLEQREWEWVTRWSGKEVSSVLLFGGEEFNYELLKVRKSFFTIKAKNWQLVPNWQSDWNNYEHSNVIDFSKHGNSSPEFLKEKILSIYTCSGNETDKPRNTHSKGENNILFKNIDKITNPNLEKELLIVLDTTKNTNLGKYQKKIGSVEIENIIDLSKFLLIATTSTSNPKISDNLRRKLNHVEPFLDKYFWTIFPLSIGAEVIIFLLIKRKKHPKKFFETK